MKVIKLQDFEISNKSPLVVVAGPCQIESMQHAFDVAAYIQEITNKLCLNFIYKSSFDKANRTAIHSKRGVGIELAMDIFANIKSKLNCATLTDVHTSAQCNIVAQTVDVLQIPALLSRQTDLLIAAGKTGKIVNIKKGQFTAPWDMINACEKVTSVGNNNVILCERGTSFGYNRLVNDMRALPIMAKTGYPVMFDATHSVQEPGGMGNMSGGERKYVRVLSRAAVAVGIAAIFLETHPDPDNAPSDGPCMVKLNELESLLSELKEFDKISKALNE